jgi:hypothetical protein
MTPEERARLSAEMFADHAKAMAAQQAHAADESRQWSEASRTLLRQLAAHSVRGVPDFAAMVAGRETTTTGEERGEHVA